MKRGRRSLFPDPHKTRAKAMIPLPDWSRTSSRKKTIPSTRSPVPPVKQVAYIHDELQFTCPPEIADAVGKVITDAATDAGVRLGLKIRVDAGYSVGKNWSETH